MRHSPAISAQGAAVARSRRRPGPLAAAIGTALLAFAGAPALAAVPPSPAAHSAAYAPKTAQHAVYTVDVNAKGQVVRIRSAQHAADPWFDKRVAGNALQVFIRAPDGTAVSGIYRLTYDYNPVKKTVTRQVTLVQAGGVDPNAEGAFAKVEQNAAGALHPASPLPDFSAIVNKK